MADTILVVNAGSSSIKFQLFAVSSHDGLERRFRGQIEGIGTRPRLLAKDVKGAILIDETLPVEDVRNVPAALDKVITFLRGQLNGRLPTAIGHRVVHGGPEYSDPTVISTAVLDRLQRFTPRSLPEFARYWSGSLISCRSPALILHSTEATLTWPITMRSRNNFISRGYAVTDFMVSLTSTSPDGSARSRPRSQMARSLLRISAAAPLCVLSPPAKALKVRWASRRSTVCPWAHGRVSSTQVFCFI